MRHWRKTKKLTPILLTVLFEQLVTASRPRFQNECPLKMLVVVASVLPKLSNKIAYPERNRMEKKLMVTVKSVKCWKALSLDVKLLKALLNWFRNRHMLRASGRLVLASQHLICLWRFMFRTSLIPKVSPICHYLREIKKVCALHFFLSLHV